MLIGPKNITSWINSQGLSVQGQTFERINRFIVNDVDWTPLLGNTMESATATFIGSGSSKDQIPPGIIDAGFIVQRVKDYGAERYPELGFGGKTLSKATANACRVFSFLIWKSVMAASDLVRQLKRKRVAFEFIEPTLKALCDTFACGGSGSTEEQKVAVVLKLIEALGGGTVEDYKKRRRSVSGKGKETETSSTTEEELEDGEICSPSPAKKQKEGGGGGGGGSIRKTSSGEMASILQEIDAPHPFSGTLGYDVSVRGAVSPPVTLPGGYT